MNNRLNLIQRQKRLGWALLVAGLVAAVLGMVLPKVIIGLSFDARIITSLGILLIGIGIAYLVRYRAARGDTEAAARMINEIRDERLQAIRARAGNRAYWVSTALVYGALIWVSFAENGRLPALSADLLWYFLAATVVFPFGVYSASIIYDQAHG